MDTVVSHPGEIKMPHSRIRAILMPAAIFLLAGCAGLQETVGNE